MDKDKKEKREEMLPIEGEKILDEQFEEEELEPKHASLHRRETAKKRGRPHWTQ